MKKPLVSTIAAFGLLCGASHVNGATLLTGNLTDQLTGFTNTYSTTNLNTPVSQPDATEDPLDPGNTWMTFRTAGDSAYPSAGTLTYRTDTGYEFDQIQFSFAFYNTGGFAANIWVEAKDKNGITIPVALGSGTGDAPWYWYVFTSATGLASDNTFDMSEVNISILNQNNAAVTNPWAAGLGTVKLTVAAIPEPGSSGLLAAGAGAILLMRRRKR